MLKRYFLGNADVVVLGQKNQHATGQTDLGRQACAFAANRVLDDLHHQRLAFKHLFFNRHGGLAAGRVAVGVARGDGAEQVTHMQKSSPLQTHIDEGRLHPRQNTGHLAQVNIANQATLQRSLHVQFLKGAVFNHRHTGFLG